MTKLLVRLFLGKSPDFKEAKTREKCGLLGSVTGIVCNLILSLFKIIVGMVFSAMSIIADGLNNLTDMLSSVITLIGFRLSSKPADKDHPFGHGRMEYMSAFIVSVVIITVGVELIISSVKAIASGIMAPSYSPLAFIVLVCSVIFKLWMFIFNSSLSKRINSSALKATAKDSLNDSLATLVILISCIITSAFALPFNLDALTALFVGAFIIWSGITSAKETLDEILGGPPSAELIAELEREITAFDIFLGIHDLLIHNYGPGRQFASVHVEVPQNIDIVLCHEQIDLCEKLVSEKTGIELVIHMDPIDTDNKAVSLAKKKMSEALSEISSSLSLHDFRMTPSAKQRTNLIFDVVVPSSLSLSRDKLKEQIEQKAREIDKTYCCVITFDSDYTGR